MKIFVFISCIIIIFLKTGNVLSDNYIFNVNNVEISKEISKNKDKLVNQSFQKAFKELIQRLLVEEDYNRLLNTNLDQIKKLISYYQITNYDKINDDNKININVTFDKDKMHKFFYQQNILYSDIINTEVALFPLLIKKKKNFIYTNNYFYENWSNNNSKNLIQYNLPAESIENIRKIDLNKENIYKINISEFFKEYTNENIIFAIIETQEKKAKVFLITRIEGKKLNKTLTIVNKGENQKNFNDKIILNTKKVIRDLIKTQNLIDVRTPSFLNVEIKLNKKNNLVEFNNRIKKIDLIDNYYVQQINKDYALIKIKYLGKINKIMNRLKDQNMNLNIIDGQWKLNII